MFDHLFFCGRFRIYEGHPLHMSQTSIVLLADDYGVTDEYIEIYHQNINSNKDMGFNEFQNAATILAEKWNKPKVSEEVLLKEFRIWDTNHNEKISWEEFEKYSKAVYGEFRRVALKLMRNQDQFIREKLFRGGKFQLNEMYVITLLRDPQLERLQKDIQTFLIPEISNLQEFPYCLVMPAADRSLDAITRYENPSITQINNYAEDILHSLTYIQTNQIIHGDVKLMNIVRLDNKLRLIDFDSAIHVNVRDDEAVQYLGVKFSSGVLPPEMFYEFKNQEEVDLYLKYWQMRREDVKHDGIDLWKKVAPFKVPFIGKTYCVRCYDIDKKTQLPRDLSQLPYSLLIADEDTLKIDSWSYGLVLYRMLAGKPLLPVDDKDDLDRDCLRTIFSLLKGTDSSNIIESKLMAAINVKNAPSWYVELLRHLLDLNPIKRWSLQQAKVFLQQAMDNYDQEFRDKMDNMMIITNDTLKRIETKQDKTQEILMESHILISRMDRRTELIEQRVIEISQLTKECMEQIQHTERVLLRGLIETSDVSIPTCFIIVNRRLEPWNDIYDTNPTTPKRTSINNPTSPTNNRRVSTSSDINRTRKKSFVLDKAEVAIRWIDKLAALGECIQDTIANPTAKIQEIIKNLCVDEFLYLYLVDEYSMKPVVKENDPIYPIEITTPAEFVPKVLPLMKVGMKAMSLVNTAAGVGRFFGYPVPTIPPEYLCKLNLAIGVLDQQSSIAEFSALQGVLDDTSRKRSPSIDDLNPSMNQSMSSDVNNSTKLSGAAIRELERFFLIHDPNCYFSDLRRVLTDDGICCWTSEENFDMMQGGKNQSSSNLTLGNPSLSLNDITLNNDVITIKKSGTSFGVADILSGKFSSLYMTRTLSRHTKRVSERAVCFTASSHEAISSQPFRFVDKS